MANLPIINIDNKTIKGKNGNHKNIELVKCFDGEGRVASNGSSYWKVERDGEEHMLFLDSRCPNYFTENINKMAKGSKITFIDNGVNGGGIALKNGVGGSKTANGYKDEGSGLGEVINQPPRRYDTNTSIENQVKTKEIAALLQVAINAKIDIKKELPEGFIENIHHLGYHIGLALRGEYPVPTSEEDEKTAEEVDLPF
jgi:hypothetical protein